jgi:acyl carrier protein
MTRDEIYAKVKDVLVDALAADEDDVSSESRLTKDLGAESIDFLDIVFKLEQAFGIKISQGELFPEGVTQDPKYVQGGKLTPEGIAALKARLPHVDFAAFEKDPQLTKVAEVFTVDTLVRFVEKKLAK